MTSSTYWSHIQQSTLRRQQEVMLRSYFGICLQCPKKAKYKVVCSQLNFQRVPDLIGAGIDQSVYCLGTDCTTGRSRFDPRQRQRIFPLASESRQALGPTQHPVRWVPGVISPVGKAPPGRDADHSPPSSAEDEWVGAIHPLFPAHPYLCCGTDLLFTCLDAPVEMCREFLSVRLLWKTGFKDSLFQILKQLCYTVMMLVFSL
jgi:hypothetical protein